MKKIIPILLLLIAIVYLLLRPGLTNLNKDKVISSITVSPTEKSSNNPVQETKTIFVPYWADVSKGLDVKDYDRVVYFGNNNLEKFIKEITSDKNKLLAIVMTNTDENINILKNKESWQKIIEESITVAKENNFQGLVLDLEMSLIPLDNETMEQFNNFVEQFSQSAKSNGLKMSVTLYGDTFYRHRPYDVKTISQNVDEIMIMAYDLHKSQGEPGPNFGFASNDDYNFQKMIKDFTSVVPSEKLTVIFGMYGYDWSVDEKKRPLNQAKSLTLNEIRSQFLSKCEWQDCIVRRDDLSKETEIDYVKSEIKDNFASLYYHIIWFEDEASVKAKTLFLKEKGIGSVGYWAYGYF